MSGEKYDPVFDIAEVAALKNDLPKAEIHILDGGHFVLDEFLMKLLNLCGTSLKSIRNAGQRT